MPTVKYDAKAGKIIREGKANKKEILEFILNNPGVTPDRIKREVFGAQISRVTVHSHLSELVRENKIFKTNGGHYYPVDPNLTHILKFSRRLKRASGIVIDPLLVNKSSDEIQHSIYLGFDQATDDNELRRKVCGITPSREYCQSVFSRHNEDQKLMFEFVNRLGACILYTLIESLRPLLEDNKKLDSRKIKKRIFASKLIRSSLNTDIITEYFVRFFSLPPLDFEKPHFKVSKVRFAELTQAFAQIFPNVYDGLEKYWSDSAVIALAWNTSLAEEAECDHVWNKLKLYKTGKEYFFCHKCGISALARVKKK